MKLLILLAAVLITAAPLRAERTSINLNNEWNFRFSHQVQHDTWRRIDLPHTWNAQDALSGKIDYKRGIGNYEKELYVPAEWQGQRQFIRFAGVNSVAEVFVNGKYLGSHRGGYGAFIFELTGKLKYGETNTILVRANNAEQLDVMPLVGDFNFYGGIYRRVELLLTDEVCISPMNYASPGLMLRQESVSEKNALVCAIADLSSSRSTPTSVKLRLRVYNEDKVVVDKSVDVVVDKEKTEEIEFQIKKPHLWNGVEDPFMYRVELSLSRDGKVVDVVEQPLGLRYYSVDAEKGFFLNGKHLQLKGVCRHQDRSEIGNALRLEHHQEDVALMQEMGVNAARLAHYPQASELYDLMDKAGIVVWAEIPFVGPGGYADKGFVDSPAFKANGREQLKELIRQHYNHPSICMWGIMNELKDEGDYPLEYLKELRDLAHSEDPFRPTTSATNIDSEMNFVTDLIAWNKYEGWYDGTPNNLGEWLDYTHKEYPQLRIAISEYGAGASIYHQQDSLVKPNPSGWWHPENWQTYYHIENWRVISARPYIWGSFIWNMFDFGAAHRTEGDRPGINDKGIVTFDRKTRKDAFYFYKANWNKSEKTLHICGKRNTVRSKEVQDIIVFSNIGAAELFINGQSQGVKDCDSLCTIVWEGVRLQKGQNEITVRAGDCNDSFTCRF